MTNKTRRIIPGIAVTVTASLLFSNAYAAPDLSATWILYRAEKFGKPQLTEIGQEARAAYDFRTSDPALKCIPASWTRVYSNPNTPLEIVEQEDQVVIRYELFDIVRTIPLVDSVDAIERVGQSTDFEELGSSVGWYDGDTLVVHSDNYGDESRVLSTIRQWAGLHQSKLMTTVERLTRDGDVLLLSITHLDPVMYKEALTVDYTFDLEPDYKVMPYGCDPEDAGENTLE